MCTVKKNGEMLRVIIWGIREKKELKGKRDEKERKEGGWVKRGLKKNRGWKTKGKRRKRTNRKMPGKGKSEGGKREVREGGDKKMKERRRSLKFKFRKISV